MAKIFGVDFSHWQANVNFDKLVNNDVRFAIFKAGEIPTTSKSEFTDPKYARNVTEARRANIISGAYYYFHPSIGASRQARHFDAVMQRDGQPDLPPVIDVEDTDQRTPTQVADVLKAMIDYLMGRGYRRPIIYSRWGFLVNQVGEPFWLKEHFLWLAQYSNELIYKPADMSNVIMWQFTDRIKLPGVGVALDGNYWLKSEQELLALVRKPLAQVEPEPEPVVVETLPVEDTPPAQNTESEQTQLEIEEEAEEEDEIIIPSQSVQEQSITVQEEGQKPETVEPEPEPAESVPVTPGSVPDTQPSTQSTTPAGDTSTGLNFWEMIRRIIRALFSALGK